MAVRSLGIRAGDEFDSDISEVRKIRINGRHFNDYDVTNFVPSEDGEEWVYDGESILTSQEVARFAGARSVYFIDEDDEDCEEDE